MHCLNGKYLYITRIPLLKFALLENSCRSLTVCGIRCMRRQNKTINFPEINSPPAQNVTPCYLRNKALSYDIKDTPFIFVCLWKFHFVEYHAVNTRFYRTAAGFLVCTSYMCWFTVWSTFRIYTISFI